MEEIKINLHRSIAEIGELNWDALNTGNLFTSYAYLHALEVSGCLNAESGWQATHLSASNMDGDIVGVMPLYLKYHSQGEYVFDHAWADAYQRAGGNYYPKLLCASPFTPVSGARLLSPDAKVRAAMLQAAKQICDANQLSSLHINFPTQSEWQEIGEQDYLMRQDKQFWWDNANYETFDEFLGALTANRRKVIKRERRDVMAAVQIRTIEGAEITERHLDQMFGFICATYDKKWGAPYLTREFFFTNFGNNARKNRAIFCV